MINSVLWFVFLCQQAAISTDQRNAKAGVSIESIDTLMVTIQCSNTVTQHCMALPKL